jgi:putative aldouronate transport system substrate-binding protein
MTTMISGGQDVGIIGFGSQSKLDYVVQSQRGAFYPLDDLLDTYGQGTQELLDEAIWDGMRIGGSIFGIPTFKDNGYYISLIYNVEMAEELGINIDDYEYGNWRELEPLLYDAKAKRDEKYPEFADRPIAADNSLIMPYNFALECFFNDSYLAVCNIPGIDDVAGYDVSTAFNFYASDEFLEFALQKQRMVEDGVYAYDYTDRNEWNYDGVNFAYIGWGYTYMEKHLFGDVFTTKMRMSDHLWTDTSNFHSAGTAISANSAQPERAMMILNLVNTDPFFATTMRFGIEGQHWVYDDEGKMQIGGERNSGPRAEWGYYFWYMAPVGNLTIVNAPEGLVGPDGIMLTKMMEYNESCLKAEHLGFALNTDPIRNEIAACTNIVQEYQDELVWGRLSSQDEVREIVAEFNDKLTANGVDKIVAEVQAQLDAWSAAR